MAAWASAVAATRAVVPLVDVRVELRVDVCGREPPAWLCCPRERKKIVEERVAVAQEPAHSTFRRRPSRRRLVTGPSVVMRSFTGTMISGCCAQVRANSYATEVIVAAVLRALVGGIERPAGLALAPASRAFAKELPRLSW